MKNPVAVVGNILFAEDKHDIRQKRFQDDCEIAGDFFNVALNFFENTIKK